MNINGSEFHDYLTKYYNKSKINGNDKDSRMNWT